MKRKTLEKSLDKDLLKQKPKEEDIKRFKDALKDMLSRANPKESEEFHKGLIKDFLNDIHYKNKYYINTKGKTDLVIHNGNAPDSPVGVLFEIKSPKNTAEMPTEKNFNSKAFQELLLYYLRERKKQKNLRLRFLIITNVYDWFVFDAQDFEKTFGDDKKLEEYFNEFERGTLVGQKTKDFYKDIAAPAIDRHIGKVEFAYFNTKEFDAGNQEALILPYKFFSPEHLLKLDARNDSNQLNKDFYAELLHIMGVEEITKDGRKLIVRKENDNAGSLIETAMHQIKSDDRNALNDPQYGEDAEKRAFNVAFRLVIIWINRILFLKLLEAQILKYNNGNKDYAFLSSDKLASYGDLNELFFQVLACKADERPDNLKAKFAHVPYLNSSLFEQRDIEKEAIYIRALGNASSFKQYSKSALRGEKPGSHLEYLLLFLDAYDFGSEALEKIKERDRLISASVLGLIFEKLNGYKDGSFFTPSFITMHMCREAIERAAIQKFNDAKGWSCKTINELYSKIDNKDIKEANDIFNEIRICDPSVGSGHFLVSALNEMIRLKHELGILADEKGKRLRDYKVSIENDELVITDDEGRNFSYNPKSMESQRVQETLFKEKRAIIENCLFGVDINQNSVEICRLRLWIELLKSAYYKDEGRGELETLPNIDINIKCGNSLINKFPLDTEYSSDKQKRTITEYKKAVIDYKKETESKDKRKEIKKLIEDMKNDYSNESLENHPIKKEIISKNEQLFVLERQGEFFYDEKKEKEKIREKEKLIIDIKKLEMQFEDIKNNKFYQNAFEWRFEFPEVMDENSGDFLGFDVVIGNPPYVFARNSKSKGMNDTDKSYFYKNYALSEYQINLYPLFIERGTNILKSNGIFCFITPNNWLMLNTNRKLRQFVLKQSNVNIINFYKRVFPSADVDSAIVFYKKNNENTVSEKIKLAEWEKEYTLIGEIEKDRILKSKDFVINIEALKGGEIFSLLDKIENNAILLSKIADVKAALVAYETGAGIPPQTEEIKLKRTFHSKIGGEGYTKYLDGSDVCRYYLGWSGEFLRYGEHLAAPRKNFDIFSTPRILVRQIPSPLPYCISACYTEDLLLNDRNSMNIIYIKVSPLYLLGILNSRLISYWFAHKFGKLQRGLFPQFKINELEQFPIPNISQSCQVPIISSVEKILSAKKQNPKADTSELEREIDRMVYGLYGLTEEEIKAVENGEV